MADSSIIKICRDPLLFRTIIAAAIADGLLLLPFFFTSNLFTKILPSGNISSLVVLLIFSLVALKLSNTYDRLRTAGLLYIRRRMLGILAPQEGVLLFTRGKDLTPQIRLLQSILISLRSGEFIAVATAALQVFFPIAVLTFTLFISIKLFLLILIFLIFYGYIFQYKSSEIKKGNSKDLIGIFRQSWFFCWMGSPSRRLQFYFNRARVNTSPWTATAEASKMNSFRYSASLLLLSSAAFLIIADTLPTGLLLPIAFFSQRLLQPAERIRQVASIYKIFTIAASNSPKAIQKSAQSSSGELVEQSKNLINTPTKNINSLQFIAPLEIKSSEITLKMSESLELLSGQICVVSAGVASGKTLLVESILGLYAVQTGRIELKTQYPYPWDLIRYLSQSDIDGFDKSSSFYRKRLADIKLILTESAGYLVLLDDPLMGMDARARNQVVSLVEEAKLNNTTLFIASNDRQLVELSDFWLTISDSGEMQLRNKKAQ